MNNDTEQIFIINHSQEFEQKVENDTGTGQINLENIDDFTSVCRTCAAVTEFVVPIFLGEGIQNKLADKIHKYLPIKVSEEDVLPQVVCYQCVSTLLSWHDLVQNCTQADTALNNKLSELLEDSTSKIHDRIYEIRTKGELETTLSVSNVRDIIIKTFQIADTHLMNSGLEFLCEKCDNQIPTLDSVVKHVHSQHKCDCESVTTEVFIKENVSIVEVLAEDITDLESDKEVNVVKLKRFNCPFCESSFSSPTRLICHLNQHVEVCIEDGMNCCDTKYYDTKLFVKHLEKAHVKHTTKNNEENICKSCGFTARDKDQLRDHITKLHVKDVKVQNKDTKQRDKWQKYIPAVCPECNNTFSNKYNMLIHMKTHKGVTEKHQCDRCNKVYKSKASLKSHQEISHKGILSFVCSFCGEAFPSRIARDVHRRIHTGDKPYTCKHCNKSYRAKNTLDRHLEIHLNVRNYECYICSKKFRRSTHLKYHLNTHRRKK